MAAASQELIRNINNNLILESILNYGPISRADLSKKLNLTKATISAIVQDLIDHSLVIEIGSKDTHVGRKPILLCFNQKCAYAISIDLNAEYIAVCLSDLKGEKIYSSHYKNNLDSETLLEKLKAIIKHIITLVPDSKYGVVGITVGIHGITFNNEIIFTPYYNLTGLDIASDLNNTFNIPVYIENEANLSVIGEKAFFNDYSNIVNISIHTGVGLGLIIDNKLYTGYNGFAGEFGHSIVVPNGKPCPCGNNGCLEQYVSETSLLRHYSQLKGSEIKDIDVLISDYLYGDIEANQVIKSFIDYMSIAVNNILNTFNPHIIIINSAVTTYLPNIIEKIKNSMNSRMSKYINIVPTTLQNNSILLGGVYIISKNFLKIDNLALSSKYD
ncbi:MULTISPECIES: ROK family transcriptional regulator [Terrisporobacter]|uniref:ROK family transcriptional regulator n=1 Tax=Terrisporobacter hibernicus TaxID=2813371 RepID=A0AAX2ZB22_9FIRM|nr:MULTISPECIES: ROK family transcriptional regulator [Terrisporobacter]MBN9646904.1 ROK family transcriptional regulator [Terrisporobacter glycolicus]UEL46463.1 ROK family transcriptional regulator [Terrisporobacter hibernicus]UPA29908.1 ROK family transcriptional regulator [Terrisporobacter glycolicus]